MDKGGKHYDDVHGLACSARTSENKPNSRSEQIDGWVEGNTRAQQTAPEESKKSSAAATLVLLLYPRRPRNCKDGRPTLWSTEYKVQPHTKSQTSAHTSTHAHNLTSCRGATKVQPTYSPSTTTHKALSLLLDRLTLQDPRQQTTVGRAEIFCLGRLHLHRARPRRPLSLISDDTRPAASASASAASAALSSQPPFLLIISLSVWQSVCLVCVCSVPRSTQPSPLFHPPLAESRGQAGRPHSRC